MDSEDDSIRSGSIRQRRNLIVISLVLLFAEASELKLERLNVFGNDLLIRNPVVVTTALRAAFLYWLLRYYVYFRDIGDIGLKSRFRQRLLEKVDRWGKKKFKSDHAWRKNLIEEAKNQISQSQAGNPTALAILQTSDDWNLQEASTLGKGEFREIAIQVRLMQFATRDGNRFPENEGHTRFTINGLPAMMLNITAVVHVLAHTRIVTEYFLPFFIAAVPGSYIFYRMLVR